MGEKQEDRECEKASCDMDVEWNAKDIEMQGLPSAAVTLSIYHPGTIREKGDEPLAELVELSRKYLKLLLMKGIERTGKEYDRGDH